MKKLIVAFPLLSLLFVSVPIQGTLSFFTGEKNKQTELSIGKNEDVFQTATTDIVLETDIHKTINITREKHANGSVTETRDSDLSLQEGEQTITFAPQRPGLLLKPEQLEVEGCSSVRIAAGADDNTFTITLDAHGHQSETKKGTLHVRAMDGFYHLQIPMVCKVKYTENTEITVIDPPPAPEPGTPPTGQPGEPGPGTPPTGQPGEPGPGTPPTGQPGEPGSGTPSTGQPGEPGSGTPSDGQPSEPGAGTPSDNQPSEPGAGTPSEGQPSEPGAGAPSEGQPSEPGAGTPSDNQPSEPGAGTPSDGKPSEPGAGTPSDGKPSEPGAGTPSDGQPSDPGAGTPSPDTPEPSPT
ncbi:hypothetical protein ACTID9_19360 [Brevibacillus fluminis]|uniref:hypothetical protein n=1 Tax=Brevibacillus fluminis TaxID=511487 RepID=UPI003F89921F